MKTDARVRYTRMRIREAFYTCLGEKPVSKITVKEICDMAEINRATFYKHYADPFELLQKLEEEAIEELERVIWDCRQGKTGGLLVTLLNYVSDRGNPCGLLSSENGDHGFAARISELFYREFRPRMAQNLAGRTEEEKDLAYLFLAGGCGTLISAWVRDGRKTPPEQAAEELNKICDAFVKAYGRA